jgi:phage recombination protein Bet
MTMTEATKTTTAVATRPRSVLYDMADRFAMDPAAFEAVVRKTVIPKDASREQFTAFLAVARDYELNPLTKEIYAFPAKGGGVVPMVSIDGWLALANRRPEFNGMRLVENNDEKGNLVSVTATVYRRDRDHATEVTEYLEECRRATDPWKNQPRRMLRHRATIQAIRYAFSISGIYEPDEADRAGMIDVTPSTSGPAPARPVRADFEEERELSEEERAAAEREADRMQAKAAAGESDEDLGDDEGAAPAFEVVGVPMKRGGGSDWVKWHATIAERFKALPVEARAPFIAAHQPALTSYGEASPSNAAALMEMLAAKP